MARNGADGRAASGAASPVVHWTRPASEVSRLEHDDWLRRRMNQEAAGSPTSLQLARRLLAREAAQVGNGEPARVGAALKRACARVADNLRDSLGEAGWAALLARAFARTEADHPALKNVRRQNEDDIDLDGVVIGVEVHGVASVTAAFEALLAALIEILGRLIGEDMAIRLIDHDAPAPQAGGEAQAP
jgi:hypothetical protein